MDGARLSPEKSALRGHGIGGDRSDPERETEKGNWLGLQVPQFPFYDARKPKLQKISRCDRRRLAAALRSARVFTALYRLPPSNFRQAQIELDRNRKQSHFA